MEWCIPLQKLEVGKVQIGEIIHNDKSLVPLAYFDGQNTFNNLNIFLPKLKIQEFEENSGKLVLSMIENTQAQAKLLALQSIILGAVYITQKNWFKENYTYDILNNNFKPIVENNMLQLYYPINFNNDIHIYKGGVWYNKYIPGLIKASDSVRIMFRIQGISFHKNYNNWTGKFRLQHRVYAILVS
jgi:hypothetical protein